MSRSGPLGSYEPVMVLEYMVMVMVEDVCTPSERVLHVRSLSTYLVGWVSGVFWRLGGDIGQRLTIGE